MYIVTLAEAKKHLNIESYFTDDDTYINMLIDVSFNAIKNRCNQVNWVDSASVTTGTTDYADYTIYQTIIPTAIKHAILLMVGNLYANREPVSFASPQVIPYALEFLLAPYINYGDLTSTTSNSFVEDDYVDDYFE